MLAFQVNPKTFLQLDKKLIEYLKNRPYAYTIAASATDAHYKLDDSGYKFETMWSVLHTGDIFDITVAGHMEIDKEGELTFLSYAFCVSRQKMILRKYHYDYECSKGKDKPIFHMQYGGNPLPSSVGYEGVDYLVSWLSEPRLFYTPMSLVLVLDQAFLEFPDDDTERIRKDASWKGHVTAAQREILAPYFTQCLKKIEKNERLYADCYV